MTQKDADELIKAKISKEKMEQYCEWINACSYELYFDIISSIAYEAVINEEKEIEENLNSLDRVFDENNPFFELNDLWRHLDYAAHYLNELNNRLYPDIEEENRMKEYYDSMHRNQEGD